MCTCGKTEPHIIATRHTFDGIRVYGWSDGDVTYGMGVYPRGLGRTGDPAVRDRVLASVELYTQAEVPAFIRRVRKEVRRARG